MIIMLTFGKSKDIITSSTFCVNCSLERVLELVRFRNLSILQNVSKIYFGIPKTFIFLHDILNPCAAHNAALLYIT
jgi:hypothetical protein